MKKLINFIENTCARQINLVCELPTTMLRGKDLTKSRITFFLNNYKPNPLLQITQITTFAIRLLHIFLLFYNGLGKSDILITYHSREIKRMITNERINIRAPIH